MLALVCKLSSRSLCPLEAAAWIDVIICAESAGLRWPSWDSCTGREANQRHNTLLLQRGRNRNTVNVLLHIKTVET